MCLMIAVARHDYRHRPRATNNSRGCQMAGVTGSIGSDAFCIVSCAAFAAASLFRIKAMVFATMPDHTPAELGIGGERSCATMRSGFRPVYCWSRTPNWASAWGGGQPATKLRLPGYHRGARGVREGGKPTSASEV